MVGVNKRKTMNPAAVESVYSSYNVHTTLKIGPGALWGRALCHARSYCGSPIQGWAPHSVTYFTVEGAQESALHHQSRSCDRYQYCHKHSSQVSTHSLTFTCTASSLTAPLRKAAQVITSCSMRAIWRLPLTYVISTRSTSITKARTPHGAAIRRMREAFSPSRSPVRRVTVRLQ